MDQQKCGALIRRLRLENGLTQARLARQIGVTDKAVSKWERALGCPDVSLLNALSGIFRVDIESLLSGALPESPLQGGNMKRMQFYLCPVCGNILTSTGRPQLSCCGRRLTPLSPVPADAAHTPTMDAVEDECYLVFPHEMSKEHHLAFVAWLSYDRMFMARLYPEQDAALRMPLFRRGTLLAYCTRHGLMRIDPPLAH